MNSPRRPLGLYLHVPFCRTRCRYCDFYRVGDNAARQAEFLTALEGEIAGAPEGDDPGWTVDTVFFGGGTPSLLEPEEIGRVLDRLRRRFQFADQERGGSGVEITMEANPSDLAVARLRGYRDAGVNRMSLGVQSFADRELHLLGRRHDADQGAAAVEAARAAGFENLSFDLMLAIPGQTESSFHRTLDQAVALEPDHLSLYLLEVHPGSEIDFLWRERPALFPGEEAQRRRYLDAVSRLRRAGFEDYEISNFARAGKRSRHNLKYWRCQDVLGFGPSAHSLVDGRRFRNPPDLRSYLAAPLRREAVDCDLVQERLFLGLRLREGLDPESMRRAAGLDVPAWERRLHRLAPFVEPTGGEGRGLRLSLEGRVLSTPVIARLLEAPADEGSSRPARRTREGATP